MAKTMDRAIDKVSDAKPFVERALTDQELREHIREAFTAARDAYGELFGRTGMTGAAMRAATDKEIQDNLRLALDELRAAAERLQGKEEHKSRNSVLLVAGVAAAVLFNPITGPPVRRWLKDQLMGGSQDDFTYADGDGTATPG